MKKKKRVHTVCVRLLDAGSAQQHKAAKPHRVATSVISIQISH